jgi:hypothetical protein
MNTDKYYIVNEFDRPCERMIHCGKHHARTDEPRG